MEHSQENPHINCDVESPCSLNFTTPYSGRILFSLVVRLQSNCIHFLLVLLFLLSGSLSLSIIALGLTPHIPPPFFLG
jgi:hypothetical protein